MSTKIKESKTSKVVQEIVPAPYVLKPGDSRFTFRNLFIEYARFHSDKT
jgi:hypothetical protein